jgi:hypothetical protein
MTSGAPLRDRITPHKSACDKETDWKALRKQRHTAHRIWHRLRAEHPEAEIAESTVRRYVRMRKQKMGLA